MNVKLSKINACFIRVLDIDFWIVGQYIIDMSSGSQEDFYWVKFIIKDGALPTPLK